MRELSRSQHDIHPAEKGATGCDSDGGWELRRVPEEESSTHLLDSKTGQDYVDALWAIALLATVRGGRVLCGTCPKTATYIGMQRCGAPGGPICGTCLKNHQDWMNTARMLAEYSPYCRHCGEDADRDHDYALSIYDSTASELWL